MAGGSGAPTTNNALTGTAGLEAGVPGQTPTFVPGQNVTSGGWTPATTTNVMPQVPGTNFVGMPAWFQSMVDAQATGGQWVDPSMQIGAVTEGGGAAPGKVDRINPLDKSIPVPHGSPIANWHKWRAAEGMTAGQKYRQENNLPSPYGQPPAIAYGSPEWLAKYRPELLQPPGPPGAPRLAPSTGAAPGAWPSMGLPGNYPPGYGR